MKLMHEVLQPYLDTFVSAYLDDILIYSKSREEHYEHLRKVLLELRRHKLHCKTSKCKMFQEEVTFLGHVISKNGIAIEQEKFKAIVDYPKPMNVREVRGFLCFIGFYRRF